MPSWLFCWICVERNLDGGADEEPKVGADIQVGGVVAQPVVDLKIAKVELNLNFTHQRVGDPVECDEEEVPSTGWVGGPPLHHRVYAANSGWPLFILKESKPAFINEPSHVCFRTLMLDISFCQY